MSLKHAALAAATLALGAALYAAPAAAQPVNCPDLYNHVMGLYQTAPASPEYAQLSAAYSASCVGPAAYAAPYPAPYYPYPAPYYGYAPGYVYGPPVGVGIGF